jgi:hypothetical protein
MSDKIEQFIPGNLSAQRTREHAPARRPARSALGLVLVGVGVVLLFWTFVVKPGQDSVDNMESIVVKNRAAITEQQVHHRELLGTIFGVSAMIAGGYVMSTRTRRA